MLDSAVLGAGAALGAALHRGGPGPPPAPPLRHRRVVVAASGDRARRAWRPAAVHRHHRPRPRRGNAGCRPAASGRGLHRAGLRQRGQQRRNRQDPVRDAAAQPHQAELARSARPGAAARRAIGALSVGDAGGSLEPHRPASGGRRRAAAPAEGARLPAPAAHAYENTVFVVGNPDLEAWNVFPDLPGARREAELVGRVFSDQGYATLTSVDEKAEAILGGLHAKAWRVLHLAGHGAQSGLERRAGGQRTEAELVSGMVIGHNTFLTPGDVDQVRYVPEVVFINCCYLGKTQASTPPRYNQLAANLGVRFIRMGFGRWWPRAGRWTTAPRDLRGYFLRRMLGDSFGEAVRAARRRPGSATPRSTPGALTSATATRAIGCRDDAQASAAATPPSYFAPGELVADLRNLAESVRMTSRSRTTTSRSWRRLQAQIEGLLQRIPAARGGSGLRRLARPRRCGRSARLRLWRGAPARRGHGGAGSRPARGRGRLPHARDRAIGRARVRQADHESADCAPCRERPGGRGCATGARGSARWPRASRRRSPSSTTSTSAPSRPSGWACWAARASGWRAVETEREPRLAALLKMAQYYRSADDLAAATMAMPSQLGRRLPLLVAHGPELGEGRRHAELGRPEPAPGQRHPARPEAEPGFGAMPGLGDLELVRLLLGAGDGAVCALQRFAERRRRALRGSAGARRQPARGRHGRGEPGVPDRRGARQALPEGAAPASATRAESRRPPALASALAALRSILEAERGQTGISR